MNSYDWFATIPRVLYSYRWSVQYPPIVSKLREGQQRSVTGIDAVDWSAVVCDSDENVATSRAGQVICERADNLSDGVAVVGRLLELQGGSLPSAE